MRVMAELCVNKDCCVFVFAVSFNLSKIFAHFRAV